MHHSDGTAKILHERYAKALIAVAENANVLDKVFENITELALAVKQDKDLKKFLFHPEIEISAKLELLSNISEKLKFCDEFFNFLKVLLIKQRIAILRGVFLRFRDLYDAKKRQQKVFVKTAVSLSDQQRRKLKEALKNRLNKNILLEELHDKTILGGMYIKIGDTILDGTLELKLNRLKEKIKG